MERGGHSCTRFEQKPFQFEITGSIYHSTGYECTECNEFYTEEKFQQLMIRNEHIVNSKSDVVASTSQMEHRTDTTSHDESIEYLNEINEYIEQQPEKPKSIEVDLEEAQQFINKNRPDLQFSLTSDGSAVAAMEGEKDGDMAVGDKCSIADTTPHVEFPSVTSSETDKMNAVSTELNLELEKTENTQCEEGIGFTSEKNSCHLGSEINVQSNEIIPSAVDAKPKDCMPVASSEEFTQRDLETCFPKPSSINLQNSLEENKELRLDSLVTDLVQSKYKQSTVLKGMLSKDIGVAKDSSQPIMTVVSSAPSDATDLETSHFLDVTTSFDRAQIHDASQALVATECLPPGVRQEGVQEHAAQKRKHEESGSDKAMLPKQPILLRGEQHSESESRLEHSQHNAKRARTQGHSCLLCPKFGNSFEAPSSQELVDHLRKEHKAKLILAPSKTVAVDQVSTERQEEVEQFQTTYMNTADPTNVTAQKTSAGKTCEEPAYGQATKVQFRFVCPRCGEACDTVERLRRHLNGQACPGDGEPLEQGQEENENKSQGSPGNEIGDGQNQNQGETQSHVVEEVVEESLITEEEVIGHSTPVNHLEEIRPQEKHPHHQDHVVVRNRLNLLEQSATVSTEQPNLTVTKKCTNGQASAESSASLPMKPEQSKMESNILSISCIRCNRTYSTMKECHVGILQCSFCRWTFESPCHLRCHIDHFHTDDVKCPFCPFVLKKGGIVVMDNHYKTSHPTVKIFHCYLCEMEFNTKACLRNHILRHFQEKGDYECPHCHMRFEHRNRVNVHVVRSHSILLGYPRGPDIDNHEQTTYMCGLCGNKYKYAGTLHLHLKKHRLDAEFAQAASEGRGELDIAHVDTVSNTMQGYQGQAEQVRDPDLSLDALRLLNSAGGTLSNLPLTTDVASS